MWEVVWVIIRLWFPYFNRALPPFIAGSKCEEVFDHDLPADRWWDGISGQFEVCAQRSCCKKLPVINLAVTHYVKKGVRVVDYVYYACTYVQ